MNVMGAASETNVRTTKLDYTTPRVKSPYSESGRTHICVAETRADSPSPLYPGIERQEMTVWYVAKIHLRPRYPPFS